MNLQDFCQNVFDTPSRIQYNGFSGNKEMINRKLCIVYSNLIKGLDNICNMPEFSELLSCDTVTDNKFSNQRWTDILAIVFDLLTEQNRNPNLWSEFNSINSELSHVFNVLFNGRMAEIYSNRSDSPLVKMDGALYSDAKKILQKYLECPFFDIY